MNGNPLPEKYFPLRLVGSDLAKNEMTGMIEKIMVHVPAAGARCHRDARTDRHNRPRRRRRSRPGHHRPGGKRAELHRS